MERSAPSSKASKGTLGDERGAAAVEFALVAPLFIMLVMGMLDYGYYFYLDLICSNAAREAARQGAVAGTTGDATGDAVAKGTAILSAAGLDIGPNQPSVSVAAAPSAADRAVTVTVSGDFTPLVGFVPVPDRLEAIATMRFEGDTP